MDALTTTFVVFGVILVVCIAAMIVVQSGRSRHQIKATGFTGAETGKDALENLTEEEIKRLRKSQPRGPWPL